MPSVETENERLSLWRVHTYDVWGDAENGYEVNDRYCVASTHELTERETLYNVGMSNEFSSWFATDDAILDALGISSEGGKVKGEDEGKIEVDGDDDVMYVSLSKDGYPLGELRRVDSTGAVV